MIQRFPRSSLALLAFVCAGAIAPVAASSSRAKRPPSRGTSSLGELSHTTTDLEREHGGPAGNVVVAVLDAHGEVVAVFVTLEREPCPISCPAGARSPSREQAR